MQHFSLYYLTNTGVLHYKLYIKQNNYKQLLMKNQIEFKGK